MATILKAGNVASGAQITSDSTGILEIKTGTGAGTTALTVGASGQFGVGGANYGSSGQVLTSNGAAAAPSWQAASAGGFSNMSTAQFPTTVTNSSGTPMVNTGSGTFNFVVPAGITKVKVTVVGGGGGSGGSSGSEGGAGGGGGAAIEIISGLTPGGTVSVTVGGGGTAGTSSPTNGGAGGTSSFGAFCSATGGAAGLRSGALGSLSALGGLGSGGDLNFRGGAAFSNSNNGGPPGGTSILGAQAQSSAAGIAPVAGNLYGGGAGAGNSCTPVAGAVGAAGIVIVEW